MYGTDEDGKRFGFGDTLDWLQSVILSFPAPWTIGALDGKYYGTKVLDARGIVILRVWTSDGSPSRREKASFGDDWTQQSWDEYNCDSHWESDIALAKAERLIADRNQSDKAMPEETLKAIFFEGNVRWDDDIFADLVCGGPERRSIKPPADLQRLYR